MSSAFFNRFCINFEHFFNDFGTHLEGLGNVLGVPSLEKYRSWARSWPTWLQSSSNRGPKEAPEVDFRANFTSFENDFLLFLASRIGSPNQNSRYARHLKSTYVLFEFGHDSKISKTSSRVAKNYTSQAISLR